MKHIVSPWLIGGFVAAIALSLPAYWQSAYAKLNLPDALMGIPLLAVFVAAFLARAAGRVPVWLTIPVLCTVMPIVVFARVVVDVMADSSSHNLWPIEIVIAGFVGVVTSSAGALLGSAVSRILQRGAPKRSYS